MADLGGAVDRIAAATVGVETAIAAGTAEQPIRATESIGSGRAQLFERAAIFLGDADRTGIAAGVVAALLDRVATGWPTSYAGRADTFAAIPDLIAGASDWPGCWGGTTGGVTWAAGEAKRGNRSATGPQETLDEAAAAATSGERLDQAIETAVVHHAALREMRFCFVQIVSQPSIRDRQAVQERNPFP